jgi:glycosyltransferase involved in cell wall biosynthesis
MKIALVSASHMPVPPKLYGGVERIVSYLTEELVLQGHNVTLFASHDSRTRARLISPRTFLLWEIAMMSQLSKLSSEFDVIHVHPQNPSYWLPFLRLLNTPYMITLHDSISAFAGTPALREFPDVPLVSISNHQREPAPWLNWQATIYHGLPLELYEFQEKPEEYLAFLGRFDPFKGLHDAIEIAKQSKMKLKIAGCASNMTEEQYFDNAIRPQLEDPMFEYVGELDDNEKQSFLGGACALLFPITKPEPFGMVMIEALACGTPVIGSRIGSVPEIITDGVTGFVVRDLREAVDAVKKAQSLSRSRCRHEFEKRFSAGRMCKESVDHYEKLMTGRKSVV